MQQKTVKHGMDFQKMSHPKLDKDRRNVNAKRTDKRYKKKWRRQKKQALLKAGSRIL